jgi:formamidopyrimidine-DNA glycosylase
MPELPDVAGYARYLDATSLHRRIVRTHSHDARLVKGVSRVGLQRHLEGARLAGTRRWGKWLFAPLEGEGRGNLVLHFGMSGDLAYTTDGRLPEHTRFSLEFTGGHRLAVISQRLIGRVSWTDDADAFAAEQDLGPDALGDDLDRAAFLQLLDGRRGAIKSTLMDQSLLSGLGNVYADEILFQAGIHPASPVSALDGQTRRDLYRTMRRVVREAARRGGEPTALPRSWLTPMRGQEDASCPRCGTPLARTRVAGRTAWFCPHEQGRS